MKNLGIKHQSHEVTSRLNFIWSSPYQEIWRSPCQEDIPCCHEVMDQSLSQRRWIPFCHGVMEKPLSRRRWNLCYHEAIDTWQPLWRNCPMVLWGCGAAHQEEDHPMLSSTGADPVKKMIKPIHTSYHSTGQNFGVWNSSRLTAIQLKTSAWSAVTLCGKSLYIMYNSNMINIWPL